MKVFQIITVSEYGGAQSVVLNLTNHFVDDNDVYILSCGNGEAWKSANEKVIKLELGSPRKGLSWRDIFLVLKLFYYRFRYRPDIVHLHSSKMGALGRVIFPKRKIVYTIHGIDSLRTAFPKLLFIEKVLKKRQAITIAISQYDAQILKKEGISVDATVIYNGIADYTQMKSPYPNMDIKNRLDKLKEEYPKTIMCIARISKQKKFELFLDIAQLMPQYAFVWIGNKEDMTELPTNVFCLGESHAAHKYLEYADVFILPSNYEGLPISILEALSFGVPVVASNVGGVREMLDETNGFVVENYANLFKEKIEYILRPENYSAMSVNARKSYLNKFTIEKMAGGYASIYKQVYDKQ
ncbi:glycosyltransferase [Dysgonomonas sp. 216]|uniref:glycosyltransferase n=1 Tax=Dysgonomonas sp. 216 TaxID=2302934 RepID=UPI0013D1B034|nr:glycosyltransferase [Dysgonomonas sp. 216]NDW18061.1 glycosyltransferase [Dysgonomonas sp. 216]